MVKMKSSVACMPVERLLVLRYMELIVLVLTLYWIWWCLVELVLTQLFKKIDLENL